MIASLIRYDDESKALATARDPDGSVHRPSWLPSASHLAAAAWHFAHSSGGHGGVAWDRQRPRELAYGLLVEWESAPIEVPKTARRSTPPPPRHARLGAPGTAPGEAGTVPGTAPSFGSTLGHTSWGARGARGGASGGTGAGDYFGGSSVEEAPRRGSIRCEARGSSVRGSGSMAGGSGRASPVEAALAAPAGPAPSGPLSTRRRAERLKDQRLDSLRRHVDCP